MMDCRRNGCRGQMLVEPSDEIYARTRTQKPEPTFVCLLCGERIEPFFSAHLPLISNSRSQIGVKKGPRNTAHG